MDSKAQRLVRKTLKPYGYDFWVRANGHLVVEFDGRIIAEFSGSASDHRSWDNSWRPLRAHLRSRGIRITVPRP